MCGTKSCAILGHSPMRFAWGFDEEAAECHDMKMELAQQIMVLRQQGVTHFSVACDYGVGLYAAEIILPPVSRFGGGNRTEKKKTIIQRLAQFFERLCHNKWLIFDEK